MNKIELTFCEIMDIDVTGIVLEVTQDPEGVYTNFDVTGDPDDEVYPNQTVEITATDQQVNFLIRLLELNKLNNEELNIYRNRR